MDLHKLERIMNAVSFEVTVAANKVRCTCPLAQWTHLHGRDDKPSMVVFPEGRHGDPIYSCQACHREGSLRDLLCWLWMKTGRDMFPLIELLDGETEDVPEGVNPQIHRRRNRLKKITWEEARERKVRAKASASSSSEPWYDKRALESLADVEAIEEEVYAPYAGSVPRYAIDRGLKVATCKAWELGHDREGQRLLFPLRDRSGRLVAISSRLYDQTCHFCGCRIEKRKGEKRRCVGCGLEPPPPYLHSKGFKRNLFLYGEHWRSKDSTVYLAEGHLDVLMLWQAGYRPVVGSFGSKIGEVQVEKLVAWWSRIVHVPDGDDAGDRMAARLKHLVAGRIDIDLRRPPDGRDPGDLKVLELEELLGVPPYAAAA